MQKSKLVSLLKRFSKEEIKDFEKFISSAYFSKGRNLKPTFAFIKKFYPEFNSVKFNEENLFAKLYPGKKTERKNYSHTVHVLFSDITALAEKFLVYNGFEKRKYDYQFNLCLAESYRDKNMLEAVKKLLLKNNDLIKKDENKFDYYSKQIETNFSLSGINNALNRQIDSLKYSRENLLYIYAYIFDVMNKFVNEYSVHRYSYNTEQRDISLIRLFVESFDPANFDIVCKNDEYETKNLVLINYYVLKSRLDESNRNNLLIAVDIYKKIFDNLSRYLQWVNYAILFNRLYGRIRLDIIYLKKANDLTDFVWGKGVFSIHKNVNLQTGSYHNALTVKASLLGSRELIEFIDKYSGKTDPKYYNDIKDYSFAFVFFKDKLYEKCLEKISLKDSLITPSLKINKHKLKICCLYELGYSEEVISAVDSFEHYLRKNKNVSEIVKAENLKFISSLKKMIRIKFIDVPEPAIELDRIIDLTGNSIFGYWFAEKRKEIII